jgi:hypothetical protein
MRDAMTARGNGLILEIFTAIEGFMVAAPGVDCGSRFMPPPPPT